MKERAHPCEHRSNITTRSVPYRRMLRPSRTNQHKILDRHWPMAGLCMATSQGLLPVIGKWLAMAPRRVARQVPATSQSLAKFFYCLGGCLSVDITLNVKTNKATPHNSVEHDINGQQSQPCRAQFLQRGTTFAHTFKLHIPTRTPLVRSCLHSRRHPGPPQRVC